MKLIFLSDSGRESFTLHTRQWRVKAFIVSLALLFVLVGAVIGHQLVKTGAASERDVFQQQWLANVEQEKEDLEQTRRRVEHELEALTYKVATLQARLMRLDALGVRIAQVAKLDKGEFDFSQPPAVGGPNLSAQSKADDTPQSPISNAELAPIDDDQIYQLLARLESLVDDRERQLSLMDRQLMAQEVRSEAYVTGRPVTWGWMSSAYGYRMDPFTKQRAWHSGVDFAGKEGGDVIAVAGGVVTESGKRYGYGNMVEINHGNGLVTRYAHNQSNLVAIGDVVEKGQAIARMGSTGRSTGPHVHFEVLRHGKPINPERYIYRASL